MTSVKIFGAGSIGNHLANAARTKLWDVTVCDVDRNALRRMKDDIYPTRYGGWDNEIVLKANDEAPASGFDYIFIGTPPDSHMSLALAAVEETPRAVLVEKPFSTPDLAGCQALLDKATELGVRVFVGYDHVVARSTSAAVAAMHEGIGQIQTISVGFREHWEGIFNAHPWLSGPADSYLGHWKRGGGALGEHSHALNLWQHLAHESGAGRVVEVSASLEYIEQDGATYDRLAMLHLKTEQGLMGDVIQDVVTRPAQKAARVQGSRGAVEWKCQASPYADFVQIFGVGEVSTEEYSKTRPQDFIEELDHVEQCVSDASASPISIEKGLDTMLVIAAAHASARAGLAARIDYSKGYTAEAIVLPR